MSVTFAPEITSTVDDRTFEIVCEDATVICERTGYSNAYAEAQAHSLICDIDLCDEYGAEVREVFADGQPVPVNVANRNAMDVLAVLGYPIDLEEPDLYGEATADDFLARVTLAAAMEPEGGLTEVAFKGAGGATWIDCARRDGYLVEVLAELRTLAEACRRQGARIVWG